VSDEFYLPNDSQSILLIGKNGSGKTRAAVWHLAQRDLANSRWVIVNHKREELINSIPGATFMEMDKYPPDEPGVYIYQPRPDYDDEAVSRLLWWIYETENVGLYVDEGYMINPREPSLNSLYTQGRSKKIPVITLSQRPARISRFAVSEAAFFQVFNLTDKRDRKTIQEFIPVDLDYYMLPQNGEARLLRPYHSIYYDTSGDEPIVMAPVPGDEEILSIFEEKLVVPESEFIEENQPENIGKFKFL
jgi:hypothetical protein